MFKEILANKSSISRRKPIYGIGINDSNYKISLSVKGKLIICPIYHRWKGMFDRCYSPEYHEKYPSYKNCSVCDDWLIFSNFKKWMVRQDWAGKQLDKDIILTGNKVYSPETCIFVTGAINKITTDCAAKRGKWPLGVTFHNNRFIVRCRVDAEMKYVGCFKTSAEASEAYKEFKSSHVREVAINQDEPLRSYLMRIAGEIANSH